MVKKESRLIGKQSMIRLLEPKTFTACLSTTTQNKYTHVLYLNILFMYQYICSLNIMQLVVFACLHKDESDFKLSLLTKQSTSLFHKNHECTRTTKSCLRQMHHCFLSLSLFLSHVCTLIAIIYLDSFLCRMDEGKEG